MMAAGRTVFQQPASPILKCIEGLDNLSPAALLQAGKDAAVLLSLAARHLVVVYHQQTVDKSGILDEWFQPLKRIRATTEEDVSGPLIDESELETFFDRASPVWFTLDESQKDAIRRAVFAINPFLEHSIEVQYLSLFSAFEGVVKRWPIHFDQGFCWNFRCFRERFPIELEHILWPVCKSETANLYWLRNELSHGRGTVDIASSLIAAALDHLKLRMELSLLAILGYQRQRTASDWLSNHLIKNRDKTLELIASNQINPKKEKSARLPGCKCASQLEKPWSKA